MRYSTSQRERELYRYYQPEERPISSAGTKNGRQPRRSSNDPILTAFAQLGALRLNAKRGFITLSTISREFIIAESGRSLSLQREDDEQQDPLWHGIGATDAYGSTPGPVVTTHFCESAGETHLVVSDMSKDDRFKDMPIVAGEPFVRFVACVPLRSPITGMAFGVYAVADDEVRDGLNEVEREFMHDMGLTVVDYLESGRVKRKQHCAERMMTAMGLFIEGKSTLRDSWLEFGRGTQVVQRRAAVPLENLADAEFGVQDPTEDFVTTGTDELLKLKRQTWSQSRSSSYLSGGDSGEGRPMLSRGQSLVSSADTAVSPSSLSQVWQDRTSSVTSIEDTTYSVPERLDSVLSGLPPDQPVTADTLKDAQGNIVLSEDLRGVFARASNLIRESIGLDGVVYFDANVTALCGGPVGTANAIRSDNEDDGRQTSVISGEGSTEHASSAQDTDNATEKCCDVLGFSTRRRSSLRGHLPSEEHRAFPESLMKMLLKRYPHGKVFNFDEDGQVMSDSEQNSSSSGIELAAQSSKLSPIELRSLRKGQSRESEAKAIIKVLPGARSVHWFPLWDVNRDRWFVASLVWSTSPARALDPAEDSAYLASFGNTVMAEVARLSAQELAHIKSDFISSISHELRSPLHGVLASVEFLQETDMTELQSDMVSNIHASGKVLLDTINHLLDFSKVNRRSKNKGLVSMKASKRFKKSRGRRIIDGAATDEFADIGVLSEEVIESIHAGFRVTTHAFGSPADRQLSKTATDNPVVVVVDIAWQQSWIFDIDPGALTRILMNLFSNSMKYTRTGFIKITIGIEESTAPRKKQRTSNLVMSVVDSGKGISQEFLNHQLFKPFKQEDSLASGTGLGLSIIKQIIHGLGGQIDFTSEQGTGSEARVRIPLSRISLIPSNPAANATPAIMTEVKAVTKGLKFNLEGFERYPDISEPPTGILPSNVQAAMLLKATMRQMLTDWFGMQENAMNLPFGASCTDVVVVMEVETHKLMLNEILKPYSRNRSTDGNKPVCIVLCCNYHPITNTVPHEYFNIIHIQQPFGPYKIAKALHKVMCQQDKTIKPPTFKNESSSTICEADEIAMTPTITALPLSTMEPVGVPEWNPDSLPASALITQEPINEKTITTITMTPDGSEVPEVRESESDALRALLVDDNEINLRLLVAYMKKLKLSHSTATNGLEALKTYKSSNGQFDVVFMDISMPVMSGIESTKHIRQFEHEQGLPPVALVALTGAANPDTRQEAFNCGVDVFLTKPAPMQTLKDILDNLKNNRRNTRNATKL